LDSGKQYTEDKKSNNLNIKYKEDVSIKDYKVHPEVREKIYSSINQG